MMNRLLLLFTLLTGLYTATASQNEANIWYFGYNAGLNFNSGAPVALGDGALSTEEGCAVISDGAGNLLFYTDGITIWNRTHAVMSNGTDLLGHSSSTQSGVIVPVPGNPNMFYVFTVSDRNSSNGFRYSVVDMALDNGLGAVTEKNILLFDNCVEKITAIRDKSCNGVWVIGHEWQSNIFRAYRIGESGIDSQPVVSAAGSVHDMANNSNENKLGYMKASPDGRRIALAIFLNGVIELFDFDNRTGAVSNPVTIYKSGYSNAYGVEFSPDGSKLYTDVYSVKDYLLAFVKKTRLLQFDLGSFDQQDIINSEVVLYEKEFTTVLESNIDDMLAAIQAGPDGKLYIARNEVAYLAVVNNPNEKGAACNFVESGVDLGGRKCRRGLPTFIQSYFYDMAVFQVADTLGYAGDTGFRIPIRAHLSCDAAGNLDLAYSLDLRFNARLFYVDSIAQGTIKNSYIDNGEQVVTIEGNAVLGIAEAEINCLYGRVLHSDTNFTPILIENLTVSNASVDADTVNGSLLVLGDCALAHRKMGISNPVSMTILPNPASGSVNLKLSNVVPGSYTVEIFNLRGQSVKKMCFKERNLLPELTVPADVAGLPSGSYSVHLAGPVGTVAALLVVVQ